MAETLLWALHPGGAAHILRAVPDQPGLLVTDCGLHGRDFNPTADHGSPCKRCQIAHPRTALSWTAPYQGPPPENVAIDLDALADGDTAAPDEDTEP